MDCLICFCPVTDPINCADPFCTARICFECAQFLVKYSEQEDVIPKCPSETCRAYYLLSEINKLGTETVRLYQQACLKSVLKEQGEKVKKDLEHKQIVEKLRKERKEFLDTHFPAAIGYVAEIAFASKLRRLEKNKAAHVAEKIRAAHRTCMNLFCNGHLDGHLDTELVCMVCTTRWCKKCEQRLQDGHVCKPEDVQSVDFINQLVRCPKCHLPVQKSQGCNSMTCANCGALFDYDTGKYGGHGGHALQITAVDKIRLSRVYAEQISQHHLKILLEIEAKEPKKPSEIPIINAIKYVLSGGDQDTGAKKLAKALDSYIRNKYANRKFQHLLGELEEMLQKGEQSVSKLNKINVMLTT